MTELRRWVDELPTDSPDRELLLAGKQARAPDGCKDQGWQALVVALGAASTTAALTAPAAGAAVAAKASTFQVAEAALGTARTAVAVKGAASGASLLLGLKSLAVGFGVGLSVLGAAEVAQRAVERSSRTASVLAHASATGEALHARERAADPKRSRASSPLASSIAAPADAPEALDPQATTPGRVPPSSVSTERSDSIASGDESDRTLLNAAVTRGEKPTTSNTATESTKPTESTKQESASLAASNAHGSAVIDRSVSSPLAEQARELAQIQRLLDAGATAEAIRRLETGFDPSAGSGLSEERDALHVRALIKAQQTTQATTLAKRFIQRYPNSPHIETMRRFVKKD